MKSTEFSLQQRLRSGDDRAFEWVYKEYKEGFIAFAKSYQLNSDELIDIYQDATIALFQNFVEKQLELEKSSVKTYLYGIGKHLIIKAVKRDSKMVRLDTSQERIVEIEVDVCDDSEQSRKVADAFKKLGEKCREVLELFYYRGFSIKEIVEATDYKDENTVKSHKSRCMKGLREKIKSS
jgi:RNA polymerase sigma-70 factor (ECF subfamily)